MRNMEKTYSYRRKELEKESFTILMSIGRNLCITAYTREELINEIIKTDYNRY